MARLQARSFATFGDVREFPSGFTSVLRLDDHVIGYGVYRPGFRWSTDMAEIAGTPTCQVHHVGFSVSGVLHVQTDDGQELDITERSVYEIPPGHDAWVVGDEPWVSIDWTSARAWRLEPAGFDHAALVTILITDIVDSTAMLHEIGDQAWVEQLAIHHARMRDHLNAHRGREINTTADSLLAVFDRPLLAVRCAEAMVASCRAMSMPIRAGIHTGEVEFIGEDPRGLAVHAAARVMSLGGADDMMVSSTTRELLEGSEIRFEDAGEHELKGLPGRRRVFRVTP